VAVNNELGKTKNFSAQMEGVAETTLLSLLGSKGLHRFQVEVVVQVEIVEVFTMNE